MGKTVAAVVGVVAAVAIAIAAPYLAPIALGALGITATATAVAVATALIATTLAVGLSLAFRALGVGAPSSKAAVGPPTVFRQSITNSFIVYGKRRVGGLLVFFHPRQDGDTHYRYFVIAAAGHRCKGLVSWMLNDEVVTLDGTDSDGMVTSGKYAGACWLWFQRGLDSETANATFVSECGGKWTADHKGNGICALYAKFALTDAVVEAGMPNITAIIEGKDDIRDPRDNSTGYTRNATLVTYDWLQIPREEGGFGAYPDEIPDDTWISAQANVCDEIVGGLPRYSTDAVITTGAAPSEIRDVLTVNQAGTGAYVEGKHLIRPGYWVPVSYTVSEDDLAGAIQVSPFLPSDAAANEVQGTYINPSDGYQGAPFTTQSSATVDIRQVDLDLAFTTTLGQANRIARIMLNRAQHEITAVVPLNISGLKASAMDTIQVNKSDYNLSNYAFGVRNFSLSADWGVVLSLGEESADIYDEPDAVTPVAPPTIDVADPVLTTTQIAAFINTSSIVDPDPTSPIMSATETTISIDDHFRRYDDKTVEVYGTAGASLRTEANDNLMQETGFVLLLEPASSPDITGLTAGTQYHVGYVDLARLGGAVTYQASTYLPDVSNPGAGGTVPGMHYVGTITTAESGSGGTTTGGGARPPGFNPDAALD